MLDELLADEWANIWMVEDVVECGSHIRLGTRNIWSSTSTGTGGGAKTVEKCLCTEIVLSATARKHRTSIICDTRCNRGSPVPPGKDAREFVHRGLRIGRYRDTLRVAFRCAVGVQLVNADGEELQYLASPVFVRVCSGTKAHIEVLAHCNVQGDVIQERAIIAKCSTVQGLKIRCHPTRTVERA